MILKLRALLIAFTLFSPIISHAAFDLSILTPGNLNGAVPDDVAKAAIKTFGIYFAHRPYTGATSMYDSNGLDLKLEVTMMKIGSDINDALAANGLPTNSTANTFALPVAKVHLRKALSPAADIGISGIYYKGQYAIGTDLKIELDDPEEGISTAIRLGYSYATAPEAIYLKNVTVISPEFVASRKLYFAEPYIGIGGRYIFGTIEVPFSFPGTLGDFSITKSSTGYTGYAFTGVNFQILGAQGFRLGMEGAFDISGFSSIGTTFGIGF